MRDLASLELNFEPQPVECYTPERGWRDDGTVEFRLHAHSRASEDGAPWVRLGFRLFGRREQVRFYLRSCERIARLTALELGLPGDPPPPEVRLHGAT